MISNRVIQKTTIFQFKRPIALFVIFLLGNLVNAQIKLEGFVKDSIGQPLELANVIAINQATKAMQGYAITTSTGEYKVNLQANSTYTLMVSYIGMRTEQSTLETGTSDVKRNFTLFNDNTLDAVELVYEMPVSVRGDTLIYNADSFKTGSERKLEDVLKNLPGVEIMEDGQIEIEGKAVTKLMVDGKDFFDGDTKLASKNIPASAVDKVQVLKNFSEVSQLSGVSNNQDNIALNIKLKEGKKNFWFGNLTAGGGQSPSEDLYLFQPKLFYYNPKYSINVIGDLNNLGEVAFTRNDYFRFSGGFRNPSSNSGTNLSLGGNSLGFLNLQNNRALSIESKFAASNFSYSPSEALTLSGFGIFSHSKNKLQENNQRVYTDSELGLPNESTESRTTQQSDLAMLKLSSTYKPNSNNQMDYDILGRTSEESQNQNVFSSVLGTTAQLEGSKPFSVNQNMNYYYTLDDKNIFALEAQHLISDEDPLYSAIIDNKDTYEDTAMGLGFDPDQLNYQANQSKRLKSNQLDAKLDYYYVLNQKSNLNFSFGTLLSRQQFKSDLFQTLDSGATFDPTPLTNDGLDSNDVDYRFSDIYLGMAYRVKTGIFTLSPGLSFHAFGNSNTQFGNAFDDNFVKILPKVNVLMQLKKSEQITFDYSMRTQFTDVSRLALGLVMNSYNSFFSGSVDLQNALSHNVRLSYYSFNLFNYTNVFANINYNKSVDNIRNRTNFSSVIATSSPFNSGFADESLNASGRYQRTFGKIRGSVNSNFNYSKFNQFIQDRVSVNENFSQSYGAEVRTNFKSAPNVELGYRYSIANNDLGTTIARFYTKAPSIDFDAYIWKSVTLRTNYSLNRFSNEDRVLNEFDFWDASIAYKKEDSKWEFEVKATNLLDTGSQVSSNTSNISVSTTEYFIQPRFVTLRLRYEL